MPALDDDWRAGGFGLYVHWPFCAAKCPYCDFNSHVVAHIDHTRWTRAYRSELARAAGETSGRILQTIFFGGGTPSLMAPETVAEVIDTARRLWPTANDMEITLEANPTSVEAGRFTAYRSAGVNRISMGIQALNDNDLKRLGRQHSVADARAAFDVARETFERISFDLIYARQNQSAAAWRGELAMALDMAADHLSLYQLTVEDGTAFGDRQRAGGLRGLPDENLAADLYEITQELCEARGLPRYEVSNHARPGAESKHNLIYWRAGDWLGIGPGAHGRLTLNGQRFGTETHLAPALWLAAAEAGSAETRRTPISPADAAEEYIMMGLRLTEGIELSRFEALNGQPLNINKLNSLSKIGLLNVANGHLQATRKGTLVLNALLADLLA